jgi:hypothetical protein
MPRRLPWLCYIATMYLAGAALANEPSPPNVAIATKLAFKGNSFVHLQNRESASIILEVSPGPLSSLQFAPKRVTLRPGAAVHINLGNLDFQAGHQTLHIISKLYDSQNAPAGMGPFLMEYLIVSATEIRKVSTEDTTEIRPVTRAVHPTSAVDSPLAALPASQEIAAGAKAEYAVTFSPSCDSNGEVRLSVNGLPHDATVAFTPNPATRLSTLAVNVARDTKPGTYVLTLEGASSGRTWNTTVTLVLTPRER